MPKKSKKKNNNNNNDKYKKNTYIPKYSIINQPAFASVKFNLEKNQSVYCNAGMMMSMDSHMNTETNTQGGIIKGLFREVFTDTSMFMTKYTGTQEKNELVCGSFLPGDIYPLIIKPGKKFLISHHSMICYTTNLILGTKSRLKGIFVGEGLVQTEIINDSDKNGIVWLAAYGGYIVKELKEKESFKLDNGLFLSAESDTDYSISKLGDFTSKVPYLSGEGLLMKFEGPCKVITTGRNLHTLERFIARFLNKN